MRTVTAIAALALTLSLGAPASAGGWAVTTLDELPPAMRATETYQIGYTIRQHGVTPVNVENVGPGWPSGTTEIQITSPDGGKTLRYKGVQQGGTGHYVANVVFPYDGRWTWAVTQGPFAPQPLGSIDVLPFDAAAPALSEAPAPAAVAAAPAQAPAPSGPNGVLATALLLVAAGAAILVGSRLAVLAGRHATA